MNNKVSELLMTLALAPSLFKTITQIGPIVGVECKSESDMMLLEVMLLLRGFDAHGSKLEISEKKRWVVYVLTKPISEIKLEELLVP